MQLKLKLHMQQGKNKCSIKQRSFDHTDLIDNPISDDFLSTDDDSSRKSRNNLISASKTSLTANSKDKPRLPIIRDRSAPNPVLSRRTTVIGQDVIQLEKTKSKSAENKYRNLLIKRRNT